MDVSVGPAGQGPGVRPGRAGGLPGLPGPAPLLRLAGVPGLRLALLYRALPRPARPPAGVRRVGRLSRRQAGHREPRQAATTLQVETNLLHRCSCQQQKLKV